MLPPVPGLQEPLGMPINRELQDCGGAMSLSEPSMTTVSSFTNTSISAPDDTGTPKKKRRRRKKAEIAAAEELAAAAVGGGQTASGGSCTGIMNDPAMFMSPASLGWFATCV